jgi:hypothetical protein
LFFGDNVSFDLNLKRKLLGFKVSTPESFKIAPACRKLVKEIKKKLHQLGSHEPFGARALPNTGNFLKRKE